MANTIDSASASSACSSLCSSVLAAAICTLLVAALANRSARSFPYTPTCAGTCLNSTSILALAKADSARLVTFHGHTNERKKSVCLKKKITPGVNLKRSGKTLPSLDVGRRGSYWLVHWRGSNRPQKGYVAQVFVLEVAKVLKSFLSFPNIFEFTLGKFARKFIVSY